MESIEEKRKRLYENAEKRRIASAYLDDAGRAILPGYGNVTAAQLAKSIRNAGLTRALFDEEARSEEMSDCRVRAKLMAQIATYGYFGHASDNHDELPSPLPSASLPEQLRPLYSETNGLLTFAGLKVWIGVLPAENETILSFSGTSFNYHQIKADLGQVVAYSETYFRAAALVGIALQLFTEKSLILTGHSLGGGLAQFSLAANIDEATQDRIFAYGFNSAGLNYLAYECLSQKDAFRYAKNRVIHYNVEGEPVSAVFGHIGRIVLLPAPENANPIERHRIATVLKLL